MSTAFPLVIGEDAEDLDRRIGQIASSRGADLEWIRTRWPRAGIPVGVSERYHAGLDALAAEGIRRVYFQLRSIHWRTFAAWWAC